jgi:hypothetical protein
VQGLVFFMQVFRLMSGATCSSTNRMTCLDWTSGSGADGLGASRTDGLGHEEGDTLVQVRKLRSLSPRLAHCVSLTVSLNAPPTRRSLCLPLCVSHRLPHCRRERQVVNPMPSVLDKNTMPLRAIFTARDPRDLVVAVRHSPVRPKHHKHHTKSLPTDGDTLGACDGANVSPGRVGLAVLGASDGVTLGAPPVSDRELPLAWAQAYFQHYNSRESYVHLPRKEYGSRSIYQELHRMSKEDGLNVEIERLNAPTHQKGHAGAYATSFDAFVALRNPNVVRLPLCRWQRR